MPLGKRTDYGDAKYAGLAPASVTDIAETLKDSLLCGFDFIVAPLVRDHDKRQPANTPPELHLQPTFAQPEHILNPSKWNGQVVGKVSGWIDTDAEDESLRLDSCAALQRELNWAIHVGLQAVILHLPHQPTHSANFAANLCKVLDGLSSMALWITVPLGLQEDSEGSKAAVDGWETWHQIRVTADHNNLLGVVLEVPQELPPAAAIARWLGEPVRALQLPTSCFTTNKRGYPTLPKRHQDLVNKFFSQNVQIIIIGDSSLDISADPTAAFPPLPSLNGNGSAPTDSQPPPPTGPAPPSPPIINPGDQHPLKPYWEYMCYLFRKLPELTPQQQMEAGYRDYLQSPLQPLQDNLESQTYETFEKDEIKYTMYEEAVYRALLDRVPDEAADTRVTVLMVVGAGRAPLVRASIKAAWRAGRKLKVYAVEKNPNAVVTIKHVIAMEGWEDMVTLVSADMRHWKAPEQADILVSELLGSFGDNELSPECLDGAQRFLKEDGISIPESYTSFLAPVSTSKLWNDVRNYKKLKRIETPYVVKFHSHYLLAAPQAVFTFTHPNRSEQIDNTRYTTLTFKPETAGLSAVIHGFAGYFESVLYKDVILSTHPPTHTPNMASWFPIYFPLRDALYVPRAADITIHMWRCDTPHKVWYEWSVSSPSTTTIHNPSGRSYYVGL